MAEPLALLNRDAVVEKTTDLKKKVEEIVIVGPEQLLSAQGLMKEAQSLVKYVEDHRKAAVRPLIDQKEQIDSIAKELSTPIQASLECVKSKITGYHAQVEKERQRIELIKNTFRSAIASAKEESEVDVLVAKLPFDDANLMLEATSRKNEIARQKKIDEEKAIMDRETARLEELRKKNDKLSADLESERIALESKKREQEMALAEKARREKEEMLKAEAAEASSRESATAFMNQPKGIRKIKKFEVVDANSVPRQFLVPDEKAIRSAITSGVTEIPGVRIWEETTVQ